MSQSVRNIFRDSRENIVQYRSQKHTVENYSLYMLFELKVVRDPCQKITLLLLKCKSYRS